MKIDPNAGNIVNIINFVRGVEPRDPECDLYAPVAAEMALNDRYGFDNTFLLQYDALCREDFLALFRARANDPHMEIGFWFEVVRPLTQAAGLPWRGRPDYDWDWHIVPGFLLAYSHGERMLLCDCAMAKFREVFGRYPASVGSWMLDSFSVEYMREKYGVRAFCICREQFGIDAYTLWGGFFNGAYYPARDNILCPAQQASNRIAVPVFRMLGPNPIYNYGDHPFPESDISGCPTIEPAWEGGNTPASVDWFYDTYFNGPAGAFSYIQLGQENSFGRDRIEPGLSMQLEKLNALLAVRDDIRVEKLCDTADWFVKTFPDTPTQTQCAPRDWRGSGLQSFWYNTKKYRCNLMVRGGEVYFRDIMMYDDLYADRWTAHVCNDNTARVDALPVVDGWGWRDEAHPYPGLYLGRTETPAAATQDADRGTLTVRAGGIVAEFTPDAIHLTLPDDAPLRLSFSPEIPDRIGTDAGALRYCHNAFAYSVPVEGASLHRGPAGEVILLPFARKVSLLFD